MLSYQHGYHAGNFADVHKHTALCLIIDALIKTGKMATCIDSHSGRGRYDLSDEQATKTAEWKDGIDRFLKTAPGNNALIAYQAVVTKFRETHGKESYPGSPALMLQEMAENHRALFFELHPGEHEKLVENLGEDRRMRILHEDALTNLINYLPARKSNGLLLVDPSYEIKDDYLTIARMVNHSAKRWPSAHILVWYPILPEGRHEDLKSALKNAIFYELIGPKKERGMYGTGMAIINAPEGFHETYSDATKELTSLLFK